MSPLILSLIAGGLVLAAFLYLKFVPEKDLHAHFEVKHGREIAPKKTVFFCEPKEDPVSIPLCVWKAKRAGYRLAESTGYGSEVSLAARALPKEELGPIIGVGRDGKPKVYFSLTQENMTDGLRKRTKARFALIKNEMAPV